MTDAIEKKPVRELIERLNRDSAAARGRRGVMNPLLVDRIVFIAAIAAVALVSVALLSMIWEGIDIVTGFRAIGSVSVLLFALLTFRIINEAFADQSPHD